MDPEALSTLLLDVVRPAAERRREGAGGEPLELSLGILVVEEVVQTVADDAPASTDGAAQAPTGSDGGAGAGLAIAFAVLAVLLALGLLFLVLARRRRREDESAAANAEETAALA